MNIAKRVSFWAFILSIIFAFLPLMSLLVAGGLSSIAGCSVNEGGAEACSLLGMDISGLLYTLFVSGWFALVTLPLGVPVATIALIVFIVSKILLARRAKMAQPIAPTM